MYGVRERYKWLDDQKELIILLYDLGFTVREISLFYGVSDSAIYPRLLEWKVKLRSSKKLKDIQINDYYGSCFEKILKKLLTIRRKRLAEARAKRKSKSKGH